MKNNFVQKAGALSNQIQAEVVNQYDGLSAEQVEELVRNQCSLAFSNCVLESRLVVEQRINEFQNEMLGLFYKQPSLVSALEEPSCVDSFQRAACTAAKIPDADGKKMLSELLGRRFEEPYNRHIASGVNKAIEIVDLITDEELNGLTVFFAVNYYRPASGQIDEGLTVLDALYEKLLVQGLPNGDSWIDNLDIHDAVRVSPLGSLKSLYDWFFESFKGYTVCGIEKDTKQHEDIVRLLSEEGVPADVLIDHELHSGWVRLKVCNKSDIHGLRIVNNSGGVQESIALTDRQIDVLDSVFDQSNTDGYEKMIKEEFEKKLDEFSNISAVRRWWDGIPSSLRVTVVGKALANANARRINQMLPDLELD